MVEMHCNSKKTKKVVFVYEVCIQIDIYTIGLATFYRQKYGKSWHIYAFIKVLEDIEDGF